MEIWLSTDHALCRDEVLRENRESSLGGKIWETARTIPPKGWFMRPIVITDLSWNSPLFQWESFGPVAIVVPYDALDQVLSHFIPSIP